MKTILLLSALLFTTLSQAQVLEARPLKELFEKIQNTDFTYKETGKLFGFMSIHSCMFVSDDIVIFKNYCFPVRNYPARGYKIITRETGMLELYEEQIPDGILLRNFVIEQFPVFMTPYLGGQLPTYSLTDFSGLMEELYRRYNPGCWSTNFSRYTETKDANCTVSRDNVIGFNEWSVESQAIVNDEKAWLDLMDAIDSKLKR